MSFSNNLTQKTDFEFRVRSESEAGCVPLYASMCMSFMKPVQKHIIEGFEVANQ